ncbi:MAG: hypothetical protein FWG50_01830 [Kiritimatiellaeota bacterium]|nr:hypothetical protein [Kiritimatiellota bacterium]
MRRLLVAIGVVTLAAFTSLAQDMRWPLRTTEARAAAQGRGGRGGRGMPAQPVPEETRERLSNVLVKMTKVVVGGGEDIITFKHTTPTRGTSASDTSQVSIPFADKDKLLEGLKEGIADLKKPTKTNESESKRIYADGGNKFTATVIRDGHKKHMEVIFKEGNEPSVFELPPQQVEVFYNALRNMK